MSEDFPSEKLTLLKHKSPYLLPEVNIPDFPVVLPQKEEKQHEKEILRKSPFLSDAETVHLEYPGKNPEIAKLTAINYRQITAISLPGINHLLTEYESLPVYEFEPLPKLEEEIAKRTAYPVLENTRKANKNKLWESLEDVADEINNESGKEIDLKNLTPYQAVYLIYELMTRRMNNEYLILDSKEEYIEKISSGHFSTSRPELLTLAIANPKKFKSETNKLETKMDKATADKHIESGFGVCRHIAATASVLYETLKEKQEGLLMNGSYLLYHHEWGGEMNQHALFNTHAYNILVIKSPPTSDESKEKLYLSVVDPTVAIKAKENFDFTWRRLSQIPSFISEFGDILGIENHRIQAVGLADEAVDRMEGYMQNVPWNDDRNIDLNDLVSDYAALLTTSSYGERKSVLDKYIKYLGTKGVDRIELLNSIVDIPAFSLDKKGKKYLKEEWVKEYAQEISVNDFSLSVFRPEQEKLQKSIYSTLENAPKLTILNALLLLNSKSGIENEIITYGYLDLCAQYMRSCIELDTPPGKKEKEKILYFVKLGEKRKLNIIPKSLTDKFNNLE